MAASAQNGAPVPASNVAFRIARADQSIAWIEINFKLVSEKRHPDRTQFVGVLRDVTQRKMMEDELNSLNARLAQLATTDGLTGLSNRRTFDGFLRREYAARDIISVLLFDIDNFKGYNDTYGHQAGDECLKAVAKAIADATFNTTGMSARYGGEEFAIILPNVSETDALRVAEGVRLTVRSLGVRNSASSRGYVTVSVGVSTKTEATLDETMLVGDADLALYEAKRLGRNQSFMASSLKQAYVEFGPASVLVGILERKSGDACRRRRAGPGAGQPKLPSQKFGRLGRIDRSIRSGGHDCALPIGDCKVMLSPSVWRSGPLRPWRAQ